MTGTPPGRGAPLTAATLPSLLEGLHRWLRAHRSQLDDLNVFPVPDSDTGSNLVATVRAALDAVEEARREGGGTRAGGHGSRGGDRGTPGAAATRGALRGARGNSGVILAQLLAVLHEALDVGPVDGHALAEVLSEAVERAYGAVAEPVEGTMLTALRVAADRARLLAPDRDLAGVTGGVLEAVGAAVARTPDQLEVLEEAGVVDAGARGLEVVLAAVDQHVTGREPTLSPLGGRAVPGRAAAQHGPAFEVQYVLEVEEAPDEVAEVLRRRLSELGDSVVVAVADRLLSVHVHTDRVAPAIEAGRCHVPVDEVIVTGLGGAACGVGDDDQVAPPGVGVLAVVRGPGLGALVARSGATALQPPAAGLPDLASLRTSAQEVAGGALVILPGHPALVPVAEKAAGATGRPTRVVAAADSAPAVLGALAVLDPRRDLDAVVDDLERAAAAVVAGEVGSDTPGGAFRARLGGESVGVADQPLGALNSLLAEAPPGCELVTLITGRGVEPAERAGAEGRIRERAPQAEVVVIDGGQASPRYILGFE